ncbi:MAG: hypothetical protein MZV63_21030, partial [Marinilabiliales bacterium]|nr:hypothetical protein [Marinilabiliales bacterium]
YLEIPSFEIPLRCFPQPWYMVGSKRDFILVRMGISRFRVAKGPKTNAVEVGTSKPVSGSP